MPLAQGVSFDPTHSTGQPKSRYQTIQLSGRSGETYTFTAFDTVPVFKRDVACIYYLSQWYKAEDGKFYHRPLFIGETDDFNRTFHEYWVRSVYKGERFDTVSILQVNDARLRSDVVFDLIKKLQPVHNEGFELFSLPPVNTSIN